eukprot:COSAG02_NODE_457_length_21950_cov_35.452794_14_plen_74_part_00
MYVHAWGWMNTTDVPNHRRGDRGTRGARPARTSPGRRRSTWSAAAYRSPGPGYRAHIYILGYTARSLQNENTP